MKLLHDGELVGEITTNRSLTIDGCLELLDIDVNAEDFDNKYDYELFTMEY